MRLPRPPARPAMPAAGARAASSRLVPSGRPPPESWRPRAATGVPRAEVVTRSHPRNLGHEAGGGAPKWRIRHEVSPNSRRGSWHKPRAVDRGQRRAIQRDCMISLTRLAGSLGVRPTLTPTFSSASFLAWAVPADPEMMAPAWPIVLPSGAVNPATYATTGFVTFASM